MTIDMNPYAITPRGANGEPLMPAGGFHFHFHAEVTIIMPPMDSQGGGDVPLQPVDEEGPSVLAPLVCDTQALPPTHPRNGSGKWLMKNHPAYRAAMAAERALELDDDEDEEPPAVEEPDLATEVARGRWRNLLRRQPQPVE